MDYEKVLPEKNKPKITLFLKVACIFLIACAVLYAFKKINISTPSEILNAEIVKNKSKIDFDPIYFKPAVRSIGGDNGFVYRNGSLLANNGILIFEFTNKQGDIITVTQQPKPVDFKTDEYKGRIQLNVATGRAIVGQNNSSTSASIFGENTFVFFKSKVIIDDDTIRALLAAFSKEP